MTDLEQKLFEMLSEERAKNDVLTTLLLQKAGFQIGDTSVSVSGTKKVGRSTWHELKAKLEKRFQRSPDEEVQDAQSSESGHYGDGDDG